MIKVAEAINSFAQNAEQTDVPPVEESIFHPTTTPEPQIGYEYLYQIVQAQAREIEALKSKLEAMQKDLDTLAENDINQLRLIADLKHKEPGKTELSRAEKIAKYLRDRPDNKAAFETLKGHLGVGNDLLYDSIKTLIESHPGAYRITKTPGDKRKRALVML
jgi:hypothetical protein